MSINTSDISNVHNVTFQYKDPNSDSFASLSNTADNPSTDNYTDTVDAGSGPYGDYEVKAIVYNGSSAPYDNQTTSTRTFTLDGAAPSVSSFSPSNNGYTNNGDDLDVSYSASDSGGAGLEFKNISISGEDTDNDTKLNELSLDDDSYTVDYWVNDTVGNVKSDSWSFTVDTSYDGDTSPEFNYDDGHNFILNDEDDDQTLEITLSGTDDEDAGVEVKCYDGSDNQFDSEGPVDIGDSDEEHTFECDLSADEDDYGGQEVSVYTEVCDEAGNCETLDSDSDTVTYAMDLDAPSVTGLSTPSNAEMFNSDFDVELLATDDASGVDRVEYYFNDDPGKGSATELSYSSDKESYEVDASDLEAGDHTLYVRANDSAGRWSSAASLDFSFDPDAVPQISLTAPEKVEVTAGELTNFDLTVENTGDLYINNLKVSSSAGDVSSDSTTVSDLASGDSKNFQLKVNTGSGDIGKHELTVSTDSPSKSKTVSLIVRANSGQKSSIDSDLSSYTSKLEDLKANVTDLNSSLSSKKKKQRLGSNFSEFKQSVEEAEKAVENGKYYKAESVLENIDEEYSAAKSSYETVKEEHQKAQFRFYLILGLSAVILLGGGTAGFLAYSDEYEFDIDLDFEDLKEVDLNTESLQQIPDKIKEILDREAEAEEFEWNGFKNN